LTGLSRATGLLFTSAALRVWLADRHLRLYGEITATPFGAARLLNAWVTGESTDPNIRTIRELSDTAGMFAEKVAADRRSIKL